MTLNGKSVKDSVTLIHPSSLSLSLSVRAHRHGRKRSREKETSLKTFQIKAYQWKASDVGGRVGMEEEDTQTPHVNLFIIKLSFCTFQLSDINFVSHFLDCHLLKGKSHLEMSSWIVKNNFKGLKNDFEFE